MGYLYSENPGGILVSPTALVNKAKGKGGTGKGVGRGGTNRGGGTKPKGAASDPYAAYVVALLHFDGANGSTTITNEVSGLTWTAGGAAALSNTQAKFGDTSLSLGGNSTPGYILGPDNDAMAFGTGDFTVEAFFYTTGGYPTERLFGTTNGNFSSASLAVRLQPVTAWLAYYTGGADFVQVEGSSLPMNTWAHLALSRTGDVFKFFLNGAQVATSTDVGRNLTERLRWVGGYNSGTNTEYFQGFIDELRITKGVGRYTSNFTPPTAPYTL